jgi:hypothetical protein
MGIKPEVLPVHSMGNEPKDDYPSEHLRVHYIDDRAAAVSFSPPAELEYNGVALFEISARAARVWARAQAGMLDDEFCGFVSRSLGLMMDAFWIDESDDELREVGDDPERPAEVFTVFARGYLEGLPPRPDAPGPKHRA